MALAGVVAEAEERSARSGSLAGGMVELAEGESSGS